MAAKVYVQFENKNTTTIVPTEGYTFLYELIPLLHRMFPKSLGKLDLSDITIHSTAIGDALDPESRLRELASGQEKNNPLIIKTVNSAPAVVPTGQTTSSRRRWDRNDVVKLNGIDLASFYLPRTDLLEKLLLWLHTHQIVVVSASSGSGKTALFDLLTTQFGNCIYISFLDMDFDSKAFLNDLRQGKVKDDKSQVHQLSPESAAIVWLDDAQAKYHETDFWAHLVKVVPRNLGRNVHIVVSATHMLEGAVLSPVELRSFNQLGREDFRLSREESLNFLQSAAGLPSKMQQFHDLEEVILNECNGLIGALRLSVDALDARFTKEAKPSETALLQYFFSSDILRRFDRCFGSQQSSPVDVSLKRFLEQCYCNPLNGLPAPHLDQQAQSHIDLLKKAGLLVETADGEITFSSPLAKRYYSQWLYPNRCSQASAPKSLKELIMKAISSISHTLLSQSTPEDGFPKEATIQHLLMNVIAACTPPTCSICPELSTVFPQPGNLPNKQIEGEVDFYLNGTLRWGIELLVSGRGIGEHISRFSSTGKYHALDVRDYIIVDFRAGQISTRVQRHSHRLSVFFPGNDFQTCHFVYGFDKPVTIALST